MRRPSRQQLDQLRGSKEQLASSNTQAPTSSKPAANEQTINDSDPKELLAAIKNNNLPLAQQIVASHPIDPYWQDSHGNGWVYFAASHAMVAWLIAQQVPLDTKNHQGENAFFSFRDPESIQLLLAAGVDINGRNKHGETALETALRQREKGRAENLLNAGAIVNPNTALGQSLLNKLIQQSAAEQRGHDTANNISLLLRYRPDLNSPDDQGETALTTAIKYRANQALWQLLRLRPDVNQRNRNGYSPLEIAAYIGMHDFYQPLLQAGANPTWRNQHGECALDYCPILKKMAQPNLWQRLWRKRGLHA